MTTSNRILARALNWTHVLAWGLVGGMAVAFTPLAAAFPVAPASAVCSGSWFDNGFPGGDFYGCAGVIDGVVDDTVPGGEGGGSASYWLGREQTLNETFTVDLGGDFKITALDLYNTHNGINPDSNDRGTLHFKVWISSDPVIPDTVSASFGTQVLDADLAFFPFTNPNPKQSFDIADTTGRYVTFRAETYQGAEDLTGFPAVGAGLSEIVIQTPEPATLALLALGIAGIGYSRRKSS